MLPLRRASQEALGAMSSMIRRASLESLEALVKSQRWDDVLMRLQTKDGRKQAARKNENGSLPIHYALQNCAPVHVIRALIEANPSCVSVANNAQTLPLHNACQYHQSPEAVDILLRGNLTGTLKKNEFGLLPLHLACWKRAPREVIEQLLQANREGAQDSDRWGYLPLHRACLGGASIGVVEALLEANPQAPKMKNRNGWLPIHCACMHKSVSVNVIRALLRAHPTGVRAVADGMNFPITYARRAHASEAVLEVLKEAYPDDERRKDVYGGNVQTQQVPQCSSCVAQSA